MDLESPAVQAAIKILAEAIEGTQEVTRPVSKADQNKAIIELWNLNWSRVEIARELGMNRGTVSARLLVLGVAS